MVTLSRRELIFWGGGLLLLAVAIVRTAVPDRSRLRPLSVEGLNIPAETVGTGQTIMRDKTWSPPADIYVMGWNYRVGSAALGSELVLYSGDVQLFNAHYGDAMTPANPAFFPSGSGYLLRKGETLTLRYTIRNTGPPGQSQGAGALVYFVPVEGN